MLWRKIIARLQEFEKDTRKAALMITGARQGGKTFIVREFARTHYESFIEFNFIKNPAALVLNKFGDVRRVGELTYLPVYFLMFLKADVLPDRLIYRVDA